ncbi:Holin of 3TMs, for gene-transfer release [Roseovarius azorensis]|uniref:Holin of 3TMs, for gene-transfer release n=1 Tax=Roseovarius azorensis TaxID=1287727 RepID=A0A1H7G5X2_9RHOB|nr:holin family protein [Roseovarius azorensis]SEK33736.1 Holin of 3TMs, for gene-transfer release [Roseovarius azorensis]
MGLIRFMGALFGGGRNVIAETAQVFRPNAEAADAREASFQQAALAQMAAEFGHGGGWWGQFIDGLNRLPRPMMAFGCIFLFWSAMADPLWFAERMTGLALVPEPLWVLMGAIVAFYFGAREMQKFRGVSMQKETARIIAQAPQVAQNIARLRALRHDSPGVADPGPDAEVALVSTEPGDNPALDDWRRSA